MSERDAKRERLVIALGWLGRLITGGVFLWAGAQKLIDPVAFAEDISNYQAFPYWTWNLAAAVVPAIEVIGGLALLTGFRRRAAALMLGSLTLAFLGLILSVIVRDINLDCGCFGESEQASAVGWPLLFRDLGLLVAIAAAYLPPERDGRSSGSP